MAQVTTTFELSPFDARLAASGALCLAANEGRDITGEKKYITSGGEHFYGAGLCKQDKAGYFSFQTKGEYCLYNSKGLPYSDNADDTQLFLAKVFRYTETKTAGGAVPTIYKTTVTKSASGEISSVTTEDLQNFNTVLVDTLTARDHFAIHALKGIMAHIDNPAGINQDAIINYCRIAYKWAEGMMLMAADARAGYEDNSEVTVNPADLESNTDKLLYNVVANLNDLGDKVKTGFNNVEDAIRDSSEV